MLEDEQAPHARRPSVASVIFPRPDRAELEHSIDRRQSGVEGVDLGQYVDQVSNIDDSTGIP